MKNQYFGDIGDFGKYAILRYLADSGISIGINWYLTDRDESNDGKMTKYLVKKEADFRHLDTELFDTLKKLVIDNNQRDVIASEEFDIVRNAVYYHDLLDISSFPDIATKKEFRKQWHERALYALNNAELVYFDPDNGITDQNVSAKKNSVKYLLTVEAADYYYAGHNLVYYCHKGRRKSDLWEKYKGILKGSKKSAIPSEAKLIALTYHRGVQRSFIFAIHPEDYERYHSLLTAFTNKWNDHFDWEPIATEHY